MISRTRMTKKIRELINQELAKLDIQNNKLFTKRAMWVGARIAGKVIREELDREHERKLKRKKK